MTTDTEGPMSPPYQATSGGVDTAVAGSMLSLFPTLVVNHLLTNVADLNAELARLIVRVAGEEPNAPTSNVGGFHSTPDFINREDACVVALREQLQRVIVELTKMVLRPTAADRKLHFQMQGWASLLRHGDYHAIHSQPAHFWSGIYYVNDNETVAGHPLSGKLELIDPRAGAAIANPRETTLYGRYLVDPQAGQLLIFPAWLTHCTHSYFGTGERISVDFNVAFEQRP